MNTNVGHPKCNQFCWINDSGEVRTRAHKRGVELESTTLATRSQSQQRAPVLWCCAFCDNSVQCDTFPEEGARKREGGICKGLLSKQNIHWTNTAQFKRIARGSLGPQGMWEELLAGWKGYMVCLRWTLLPKTKDLIESLLSKVLKGSISHNWLMNTLNTCL